MRAKPFLLGLTTGIVSGLATVIFTAPQSGKQLRMIIQQNAKQSKLQLDDLNQQLGHVIHSISTLKDEAKTNIPKVFLELKESFSNFTQDMEPDSKRLKEELEYLQKSIDTIENNLSVLNKTN